MLPRALFYVAVEHFNGKKSSSKVGRNPKYLRVRLRKIGAVINYERQA
jgi:hypothetical protein